MFLACPYRVRLSAKSFCRKNKKDIASILHAEFTTKIQNQELIYRKEFYEVPTRVSVEIVIPVKVGI